MKHKKIRAKLKTEGLDWLEAINSMHHGHCVTNDKLNKDGTYLYIDANSNKYDDVRVTRKPPRTGRRRANVALIDIAMLTGDEWFTSAKYRIILPE
jgi:hypothetical protein